MRIRTQFIFTMALFGIILVAISVAATVTTQRIQALNTQEQTATKIARGASDLGYLANDYVVHRESQLRERWETSFASFSKNVSSLQVSSAEQQALVRNIQANTQRLGDVFSSVSSAGAGPGDATDNVFLQTSWSRIAVQSQSLIADSSRLSELLHQNMDSITLIRTILIYAILGVFVVFLLSGFLFIYRRLLGSLGVVQAGAQVIGGGNLDYRIREKGNDEFTDLSRAFNLMTGDLKQMTASKTDLEREIEERKKTQEALEKSEEKYRTLFSSMSEGFGLHEIILDANGKPCDYRFLELNDAFEEMTGLSRDQVVGKTVKEVLPNIESYWVETYGRVALSGEPAQFENYSAPLDRWYGVHAYSPAKNQFAVLFRDITERKKAETTLQEQAAMLANVSDAIIGYDANYAITYWNRAAESIYGYDAAEAMGKVSHVLLKPMYPGTSREDLLRRVAGEGRIAVESTRTAKDGRTIFIETHVIALKDTGGKTTGYVAVDRDITDRRKAEAQVAHLASFPALNPNPVVELDSAGKVLYANPVAIELFPNLMVLSSKHPYLADAIGLVGTSEKPMTRDAHVDGLWYEQTVTYFPASRSYRVYGRDITGRIKAEELLRETRDYLENLLNYANAPIIVWNPGFEITAFNRAFERLTGHKADEVLGKKLDILFPNDTREASMDHIRKAVSGERWEVVEIPILRIDGTVRTVLWNSATLYASDGKTTVATIAQGQDITERKLAGEALKRTNAELEASNRELEAFSYSVSHDLRAPLRSMEGFSGALIEDYADKLDEQGKQYLAYVQESSQLMARLIDDLLKLSRVTRADINYEELDLSSIAGDIVSGLRKDEPQREVDVRIAPNIKAQGDRNLIRIALENLVGNAWKFTSKTDSARIEVGASRENGRLAYYVRDNGVGFDMTYVDKLFKPFQRLHKATDFGGTGIGLATVQRVIRRHGGDVWAESRTGKGATFYFTL